MAARPVLRGGFWGGQGSPGGPSLRWEPVPPRPRDETIWIVKAWQGTAAELLCWVKHYPPDSTFLFIFSFFRIYYLREREGKGREERESPADSCH